jgi:signal transduction histidine kinase
MLTIGGKLALGIGVLLALCVLIGLVSYTQTDAVNERLEELTQIREPINSAVYGIENYLAETAFAALAYSATGDHRMILGIERGRNGSDSNRNDDSSLIALARMAGLRTDLRDSLLNFRDAALEQVQLRDIQVQNLGALRAELQGIDVLLSDRVLRSISVDNPIAYRRLQVALGMQVQMNALAKSLGNYLLTGEPHFAEQLNTTERQFTELLKVYQVLLLSAEEKLWAGELRTRSTNGLRLARALIESEEARRAQLATFMGSYRSLASTLNERVQARTERGLARAKEELLEAGRTTNNTILGVLAVSLLFGILAGVWTTRSITRPLAHLTSVMVDVGHGNRTRRVRLSGGDELQLVGDTFNAMVGQLEKAERDRIAGLRRFASSMQRAQEEERARISRELHDDLCQRLTGMKFRVEVLEEESTSEDRAVNKQLRDIRDELDRSIGEVRRISSNLRPSVLDDFGFATALRLLAKDFEKHSGIAAEIHSAENVPADLQGDVEIALYRISQEALANITKHAHASTVQIGLTVEKDSIQLRIHDNGQGIVHDDTASMRAAGHGLGLLGMRERAELLGGSFAVETGAGTGTTILVTLPLQSEDDNA